MNLSGSQILPTTLMLCYYFSLCHTSPPLKLCTGDWVQRYDFLFDTTKKGEDFFLACEGLCRFFEKGNGVPTYSLLPQPLFRYLHYLKNGLSHTATLGLTQTDPLGVTHTDSEVVEAAFWHSRMFQWSGYAVCILSFVSLFYSKAFGNIGMFISVSQDAFLASLLP